MLCHKSHRVKCCYSDSSSVPRAPFISSLRGGRRMTRRPLTQAQHQHHQVPAVRFQYSPRSSLIGPAAKPASPRDSQQQEKHTSTRLLWGATSVSRRTVVASASTSEPSPVDADRQSSHRKPEETQGLLRMARLNNLLPSIFMVMIGAWTGAGRGGASILSHPVVLTVAVISGCITSASMIINDYFDWASGVDAVNRPDKPLITGQVNPTAALLASLYMYTAVLVAACLMDSLPLRSVIALSAGLTILYTPFLKRISVLKNLVVAAVIALSPLAGALAVGAAGASLTAVITSCVFAFLGVVYREIVMDITDEEGDREAGIRTLPVILGKQGAMVAACWSLVCAALVGLSATVRCGGLAQWAVSLAGPSVLQAAPWLPSVVCSVMLAVILEPVFRTAGRVFSSGMSQEAVSEAVDKAMPPFALGMLLLSAVA